MKKMHIRPTLILLALAVLASQPIAADEPHQMFLPMIPVNNGGCDPAPGDTPPATWVFVTDPSITVEITNPCDPMSHILSSEFYQDAAHPNGY